MLEVIRVEAAQSLNLSHLLPVFLIRPTIPLHDLHSVLPAGEVGRAQGKVNSVDDAVIIVFGDIQGKEVVPDVGGDREEVMPWSEHQLFVYILIKVSFEVELPGLLA